MANLPGPRFVVYFAPVLDALRSLGSSARPKEVYDWIAKNLNIPRDELEGTTKGGQSRFENKVGWARFYLAKAGFIDTERRGVWVLTEAGRGAHLSHSEAYQLFRQIHEGFPRPTQTADSKGPAKSSSLHSAEPAEATAPDEKAYVNQDEVQEQLVRLLRSLSDKGFEELCARLLRHIGFENVTVTGQAGDQGVDGVGHLIINRFVRTKVMFQCKRYDRTTVGPDKIRDFRGAIQGRAERGIFMTTGSFTRGAVEEAARENTTAVELVDIDRLMELLIEEGLGVRESKALSIEPDFFRPYLPVQSQG